MSKITKLYPDQQNVYTLLNKLFIIAQIFGFLPTQGLAGTSNWPKTIFKWTSFKVLYALFTIIGASLLAVMQFHKMIFKSFNLLEFDRFCFFLSGATSAVIFFLFSKNCGPLFTKWRNIEMAMIKYPSPKNLKFRVNSLIIFFLSMALIEHVLIQSTKIYFALECKKNIQEALLYFLSNMSFSYVFSKTDFNVAKGLLLQAFNVQITFSWTFLDLFIMVLSEILAARFTQIADKTKTYVNAEVASQNAWKHLRQDYINLCKLTKVLDNHLSHIILLAYCTDLFFILSQLFSGLRGMRNNLEITYFMFSFSLLIARTICLCLCGAKINVESKKSLKYLCSASSSIYNKEMKLFTQHLSYGKVALTGKNLFYINRGLILQIAGAIVTYELVLIQFNQSLLKNLKEINTANNCVIYI